MTSDHRDEVLNERAQHLLRTLVDCYIRDGQPVGSRALSRDSGLNLSAATVRNVMADLEELGFVHSPHTSAGRVPTDKAYRFFVDTLLRTRPLETVELEELRREFDLNQQEADGKKLVSSASQLLSKVTHLAGVVTLPRSQYSSISQLEFVPLSENRVLAIMVLNNREVQNRILQLQRYYSPDELRRAAHYLTDQLRGRTVAEARGEILRQMQEARESMNQIMLDAVRAAEAVVAPASEGPLEYVIAGETNLMEVAELSSVDKLRRLFEAFNERRDFLDLLDRSLHADGVQIFIGQESGYRILDDISVIAAPYSIDEHVVGVLGVIGPTRMAYERVIPIVDMTAKLLSAALNSRR
ncbi:MAG: heat-inducible transcriptional repressor HrcA [Steroidobacteraceae bacterium]|nr:heat-inducible transcriptional repressor HrcA [Steroidobacteraceae bacterium]MDW8258802.1 heat-inducible transcriptional repressor HrcA [Gammaproteobacteria bacterium]